MKNSLQDLKIFVKIVFVNLIEKNVVKVKDFQVFNDNFFGRGNSIGFLLWVMILFESEKVLILFKNVILVDGLELNNVILNGKRFDFMICNIILVNV